MQRRLLISMLAVAVVAVFALGIPLAFVLGRLQVDDWNQQLQHEAHEIATTLQNSYTQRSSQLFPFVVTRTVRDPDRYVTVLETTASGRQYGPYTIGLAPPRHSSRSATYSTANFTVTVTARDADLTGNLDEELLLVAGVSLVALGLAVVLGLLYARRFTRPLEELAAAADRLGSGDASPLGRRYGIQELDRVAEGLDGSVQRINDLLSAERDFAVDASHQLRTPLTALSMRLEEMIAAADYPDIVREEGSAALAQTERLTDVVGQLLGRARRTATGIPTVASVDEIVGQQVVEWEPAFRRRGRRLALAGEKGLFAFATPGGASQVIATLLDNALVHGDGTVTIRTSRTRRSVVVEVRDEGSGVPPELAARIFERSVSGSPNGTGLGLALARTLAAADGGQVVLVRPRPAVFALFLPHATADTELPAVAGPA
jgi:signal transduction histidine kinase